MQKDKLRCSKARVASRSACKNKAIWGGEIFALRDREFSFYDMIDRPTAATLTLTLPDGSERTVPAGTLPSEVIKSIGERLLQAAVAVEVNGTIQDLMTPLRTSGPFRVLTERDAPALDVLRHSAAHVLATAVRRLRPDAKIGFGPSIDEGFYYDFEVADPFTPDDLASFENEMRKVTAEKYPFVREEVNRAEARKRFTDDPLKLERLSELGEDEIISTYTDGPFIDLCRGPHVPDTSRLKHFKLTHTAGAYWRGDSRRQMLQRIYGTAFFKKEDLDAYLTRIEEARKRDHRVLGRQLDLFMMHQYAPGAVFWTEKGTAVYNALNDFIREGHFRGTSIACAACTRRAVPRCWRRSRNTCPAPCRRSVPRPACNCRPCCRTARTTWPCRGTPRWPACRCGRSRNATANRVRAAA